jgi:hypothetical protein
MKMYEKSWDNITRSEDAIWKVFAAYTALFAGLAVANTIIGIFGFAWLMVFFSLCGMFVCINANQWFARNITMIKNVEKEFLSDENYGTIVPIRWSSKTNSSFFKVEIWWIIFFLFLAVSIGTIRLTYAHLDLQQLVIILITQIIGLIVVALYCKNAYSAHKGFVKDAPGRNRNLI